MNRTVSLWALLAAILMTAAPARAEVDRGDGIEHRVSAILGATPVATFKSPGGKQIHGTGETLFQTSFDLSYGVRPLRYLELGIGAGHRYHALLGESSYGHALLVPAHVGLAVPIGRGVELLLAGEVGFAHLWLPDESLHTLRAAGVTFGPRATVFITVVRGLDLLLGAAASWELVQTTNGTGYLEDLSITVFSATPLGIGLRARW